MMTLYFPLLLLASFASRVGGLPVATGVSRDTCPEANSNIPVAYPFCTVIQFRFKYYHISVLYACFVQLSCNTTYY